MGPNDPINNRCIVSIKKYLKGSYKTDVNSRIIYLTSGYKQEEKYMLFLHEMKDALLNTYSTTNNTVVGIITWIRGAARIFAMEGRKEKELDAEKWDKNMICCKRELHTYGKASVNTWPIANVLGYLHEEVVTRVVSRRTDSYCIGHSLGAQLCGFFGKILKEMTTLKGGNYALKRIIGLDPAGPIFDDPLQNSMLRLGKDDADIVEIIHTNAETKGYTGPLGDLDFYINSGKRQPWCPPPLNHMDRLMNTSSCSHYYAVELFMQFIKTDFPCHITPMKNKIAGHNIRVDTTKLKDSKYRPTCIDNKPVFYLGDVSNKLSIPKGTYYVDTDKGYVADITRSCK